jgi:hypothetical protein
VVRIALDFIVAIKRRLLKWGKFPFLVTCAEKILRLGF